MVLLSNIFYDWQGRTDAVKRLEGKIFVKFIAPVLKTIKFLYDTDRDSQQNLFFKPIPVKI